MTAVASPPTFPQISRTAWGTMSSNSPMNPDEFRAMFAPRKQLSRSNSSSSLSSTSSNTTIATTGSQPNGTPVSATSDMSQWSANTGPRKRPQARAPWAVAKADMQPDFSRPPPGRPAAMAAHQSPLPPGPGQPQMAPHAGMRPMPHEQFPPGQPVLYLLSLNGTFERKTIAVPFAPDSLRIGRQTNQKTVPTPTNGFFDSKVLSRQHAEIFAERNGKIYIRDVKSSNGTFVNGTRLSQENRESDPHELQTADHLELGIDIVSEDQKTVVHHKVAAKVEHAGFLSNTNNVLDMNFGDLDPANGTMMMPNGPVHMRGRAGSNSSMTNGGRMMPNGGAMAAQLNGMAQQRPFFLSPIATDQILKRLATEMRNARLQAQDLNRTNQFVNTLLSKDDVKDLEKPDAPEPSKPQHMVNGSSVSFRSDHKARFSDPPAPPPQQPLPEKPDMPSSKRGSIDRSSKSGPARQDNVSQIIQLTEALNNARRDMDTQSARMRELEVMLQKEREARELAEDLARRLEWSENAQMNGSAKPSVSDAMDALHEDARAHGIVPETDSPKGPAVTEAAQESTKPLQSRLDTMDEQMRSLLEQLDVWKERCERAETERDEDRKTLADMVVQLRAQEAKRTSSRPTRRSRSRGTRSREREATADEDMSPGPDRAEHDTGSPQAAGAACDGPEEGTRLSRSNTITPATSRREVLGRERHLQAGLPYASMVGVVLMGMGLMAYINGWQPPPPRMES